MRGEVPVLHVARRSRGSRPRNCCQRVCGTTSERRRRAQTASDDQRRRQDPPRAPRPERRRARRARSRSSSRSRCDGDQEARDREEHVDADEAAGQRGRPEVGDDDERDRDAAQGLDLGAQLGFHPATAPAGTAGAGHAGAAWAPRGASGSALLRAGRDGEPSATADHVIAPVLAVCAMSGSAAHDAQRSADGARAVALRVDRDHGDAVAPGAPERRQAHDERQRAGDDGAPRRRGRDARARRGGSRCWTRPVVASVIRRRLRCPAPIRRGTTRARITRGRSARTLPGGGAGWMVTGCSGSGSCGPAPGGPSVAAAGAAATARPAATRQGRPAGVAKRHSCSSDRSGCHPIVRTP